MMVGQRKPKRNLNRYGIVPYMMIFPFVIAFVMFFLYPAGYSLYLSFFKYRGYGPMTFVGFNNYKNLLNYSGFWKAVGNTLFYFVLHIIPSIGLGFVMALLLQSKSAKNIQRVFKPIIFLPQVIPTMATALVFRVIFSTNTGALNQFLGLSINWLDNPTTMRLCAVFLICWRGMGWFVIVFLAGLTTIDPNLYEAASIDGATAVQRTFKITLPLMRPTILFALINDAISSFKLYTEVNVLVNGGGQAPTDVAPIMNIITSNMTNGVFGMASAAGWLLFIMILILSLIETLLTKERK